MVISTTPMLWTFHHDISLAHKQVFVHAYPTVLRFPPSCRFGYPYDQDPTSPAICKQTSQTWPSYLHRYSTLCLSIKFYMVVAMATPWPQQFPTIPLTWTPPCSQIQPSSCSGKFYSPPITDNLHGHCHDYALAISKHPIATGAPMFPNTTIFLLCQILFSTCCGHSPWPPQWLPHCPKNIHRSHCHGHIHAPVTLLQKFSSPSVNKT